MSVSLMPEPRQRYYNNDGTVAALCLLYTYAAGTSTPKATYQDSAGTVPHPNPIVLDAKGEAVIYWTGNYKVDLKTAAGVQVTGYPVDNYQSLSSATESAQSYLATVAGTPDVITAIATPPITAYSAGQVFRFIASGANTTNVTININGLGAKAITKNGTTALVAGDIPSGAMIEIIYDGTRFQFIGVVSDRVPSASLSALVKAYGLQYSGVTLLSSDTTLTTAHKGRLVIVAGSSGVVTLTMPASATFSDGDGISFLNASATYAVTLTRAGSDQINPGSAAVSSVTLNPGDTFSCALYASGTNWEATGGSAQLAYTSIFGSSIASSGYQKLPSGLIIQWGQFTQADNGGAVAFTFTHPIAFPNAARQAFITVGNNITGGPIASAEGLGATTTTGFTLGPAASRVYRILIIGN